MFFILTYTDSRTRAPPFVDDDPMGIYQKILAGKIDYPSYFNKYAKDLISRLLTADITKRLGNLKNGVEDIKRHPWFSVSAHEGRFNGIPN